MNRNLFRPGLPRLAAALSAMLAVLSAQEPLPPIQFNVPYVCANGLTYVIERCQAARKGEVCFFRMESKGQPPHETFNIRSQLTGILNTCPAAAAPKPVSSAAPPLGIPTGRPTDPPHLREMPTVERVLSVIQGANPTDTLARQITVLGQLERAVERLMGAHRYDKTPDELQVMSTYARAAYDLAQAFAKTHSPEEVKAFDQLQGRYLLDTPLFREAIDKLYSPALRAEFGKVDAAYRASAQKRAEAAGNLQKQQSAAAEQQPGNSPFIRNDPGTLAARRCVELGGNDLECIGKGLKTGVAGLFGGVLADGIAGKAPERAGLTMTGIYQAEGSVNFSFDDAAVRSQGCGKLVPGSHNYTVANNGSRFVVTARTEPKPLVLTLGPDGRLTGPALFDLKGQIITGYRDVWVQAYANGAPLVSGACNGGACGYWTKDPIFAPKTERCAIGALRPAGPTGNFGTAVTIAAGIAFGQPAEQAGREAQKDLPDPGVRLIGRYASQGGLALEFSAEGVTLDCGEAHVTRKYAVENVAGQVLVTVKHDAAPFTLALQSNGSLTGSGSAAVAGRVVTGSTPTGIQFAARNMSCPIGTLLPNAGAAAGNAPSAAPSGGPAVISLTSGLPLPPGRPNPGALLPVHLLKESFASLVTKSGIRPEAGKSAIEAWEAACASKAPECAQAANTLRTSITNSVKLDNDGKASFPALPPGRYFVFAWMSYQGRHLVWDLPVDLANGAVGIVLDQRNAVSVK